MAQVIMAELVNVDIPHTIYKIFSEKGDKVYYGSTSESLANRFRRHKSQNTSSQILFEEYGYEYCHIEPIETVMNKEEALLRERWYIENYSCVNKVIPIKTEEERKQYQSEWYEKKKASDPEEYNKRACEIQKVYYQNNREKLIEKSKAYERERKEEKAEYNKKYFEEFKKTEKYQKKIETLKSEVECPICHLKMMKANLSRHNKIKHTDRIVKCEQCDWEGHQGKLHYHMRSHKKL